MGAALATTDLASLERVIADGLRTFVDVGQALTKIRDGELYKVGHRTFEAYCSERWELKRSRAYELMEAAAVVVNLPQTRIALPTKESHAAPLAKLPPKEQPKAWAEAVKTAPDGVVTAKHVAAVVTSRLPAPEPKPPKRAPAPVADEAPAPAAKAPIPAVAEPEIDDEPAPAPHPAFYDGDPDSVSVALLLQLAEQRASDPEYFSLRAMQRAVARSLPSRGQRMIDFVLDGGELALLRLGLDWSVTEASLKRAYRTASGAAHPDRGGSQAGFVTVANDHKLVRAMLGLEDV